MICPNPKCNITDNASDAVFCHNCGYQLKKKKKSNRTQRFVLITSTVAIVLAVLFKVVFPFVTNKPVNFLLLAIGSTKQLTIDPFLAPNKTVTWNSSNPSVATVSAQGMDGLVTAISEGTTIITATTDDNEIPVKYEVTVTPLTVIPTSIHLNKSSLTLIIGNTEQLSETIAPDNSTNKIVTWRSSNSSVATVNSQGLVKAISEGTTTITVITADGNKIADCMVTVKTGGATYLRTDVQLLSFDAAGSMKLITVTTDGSTYDVSNLPLWCSVQNITKESFQIVCQTNTGATRSGRIIVRSDNKEAHIDVEQAAPPPILKATHLSTDVQLLSFDAGGSTKKITVTTDGSTYAISNLPSWCSVQNIMAGSFQIVCMPNTGTARSGRITVRSDSKVARIEVEQAAPPILKATHLSTDVQLLSFDAAGSTKTITVMTDGSTYDVPNIPLWCSVQNIMARSFQIVCQPNTGTARSGRITVRSDSREIRIDVEQAASPMLKATHLSTDVQLLSFDAAGSTKKITVMTDGSRYSVTNLPSWCSVQNIMAGSFQIVCQPNIGNARKGKITVRSDNKSVNINVEQAAPQRW